VYRNPQKSLVLGRCRPAAWRVNLRLGGDFSVIPNSSDKLHSSNSEFITIAIGLRSLACRMFYETDIRDLSRLAMAGLFISWHRAVLARAGLFESSGPSMIAPLLCVVSGDRASDDGAINACAGGF